MNAMLLVPNVCRNTEHGTENDMHEFNIYE